MIKITYRPEGEPTGRLAIVGKTLMYDSGGLSLKPGDEVEVLLEHLEDAALLARRRASVAHCPHANLKLGSGIAPVPALRGRGFGSALRTLRTIVRALPHPPAEGQKRFRFAFLHGGGPAPGMRSMPSDRKCAMVAPAGAGPCPHSTFGVGSAAVATMAGTLNARPAKGARKGGISRVHHRSDGRLRPGAGAPDVRRRRGPPPRSRTAVRASAPGRTARRAQPGTRGPPRRTRAARES